MTGLLLRIEGEPKSIYMSAFVTAVNSWVKFLGDLDVGISGRPKGSLDWVVSDLSTGTNGTKGSLKVAAIYHSRLEDENYGPQVEKVSISGLRLLEIEGLTPPYLSEAGIGS